jgi:hypothetical protein
MCAVGTVANIHSLAKMEEGLTVDYTPSLIYAGIFIVQIMKLQFLQKGFFFLIFFLTIAVLQAFSMCCISSLLLISGGFRLLSLVNNSEEGLWF